MTPERWSEIAERYRNLRIAVVGDFCLDRYLEIDPTRTETSIETGLPVHNVVRVRAQPGAAGTILNNLVALGVGALIPIGWCGDDGEGYELRRALASLPGVSLDAFGVEPSRRTFTYCKPLVIEVDRPPRELNRLDSKNWTTTPTEVEDRVCQNLSTWSKRVDAMIVMDQVETANTGVVTDRVLRALARVATDRPDLRIVGDSRRGVAGWPAITLKMNRAEFDRWTGRTNDANADRQFTNVITLEAVADLAKRRGCDVVVTLAEQGMLAATPAGVVARAPALPLRGPIDVVGAGDAVTANITAALAAGANWTETLTLASVAASVVLHKLGTTGAANPAEITPLLASS